MRFASSKLLQTVLTTVILIAGVRAAEIVKPDIKPGLWEISMTPKLSGQLPISDADLAKMTPERRAQVEAAFKSATAKPRVLKECMTPEKIAHGFSFDRSGNDSSCTRKVISSSANELTLHDECNRQTQKTVSDAHFEVKGGTQTSGRFHVVMTSTDGKSTTWDSTFQGKWLGASCGSVKDIEMEK
jgi:Protein of unknown function (DUF3617)